MRGKISKSGAAFYKSIGRKLLGGYVDKEIRKRYEKAAKKKDWKITKYVSWHLKKTAPKG